MKRQFLGIWLILATAMLFSIVSLIPVASADDDVITTNAEFLGQSDIGPDTLRFFEPYQDTATDPKLDPERKFKVGDPFWMRAYIEISGPKLTTYFIAINLVTKKPVIYKVDWDIPSPGKWKLSVGLKGGAPPELKGFDILIVFAISGQEKAKCPQPWWFIVY